MKNKDNDLNNNNLNALAEINPQVFKNLIHEFRGKLVMLDADLAAIYGYDTGQLNLQVKHNFERFDEEDFMFQLNNQEFTNLKLKFSTSSWGGKRKRPYAFTEQGVYMLMTVLKGPFLPLRRIVERWWQQSYDNQHR